MIVSNDVSKQLKFSLHKTKQAKKSNNQFYFEIIVAKPYCLIVTDSRKELDFQPNSERFFSAIFSQQIYRSFVYQYEKRNIYHFTIEDIVLMHQMLSLLLLWNLIVDVVFSQ